jgi:uncharacterized protein YbjT (DUF2867 family)
MTVLVVGGNGQLGVACCAELASRGIPVRATVRDRRRASDLPSAVEVVELDLTDGPKRRGEALAGVDAVILSANSAAPRRGDRPGAVEDAALALIDEATAARVGRIVLPSIPVTAVDDQVPIARARREVERRLAAAPVESWVLRLPPFMEAWLALVGSSIPLRGEPHATIGRPSPFLRRFRSLTGSLVEDRGRMLVPGPATARHTFIAVNDAARACVEATQRMGRNATVLEVAGPEVLTWNDVAATFASVLDRPVKISTTPAAVYAAAAVVMRPFGGAPWRTMALNRFVASHETAWSPPGGGLVDAASMTTVEQFLRGKVALDPALPLVP